MPAPRIDALSIVVQDLARSVAFYGELGCTFPDAGSGAPHLECRLGDFSFMLDDESALGGFVEWPLTTGTRVTLAADCGSPDAVDALYARLAADGSGVKAPHDAPWGQRYAVVRDPDGNHVDLYAVLPGAAVG